MADCANTTTLVRDASAPSAVARFPTKRKAAYPNGKINWRGEGAPEGVAVLRPKIQTRYMPERTSLALVLAAVLKGLSGEEQREVCRELAPLLRSEDPNEQAAWNFAVAAMNARAF